MAKMKDGEKILIKDKENFNNGDNLSIYFPSLIPFWSAFLWRDRPRKWMLLTSDKIDKDFISILEENKQHENLFDEKLRLIWLHWLDWNKQLYWKTVFRTLLIYSWHLDTKNIFAFFLSFLQNSFCTCLLTFWLSVLWICEGKWIALASAFITRQKNRKPKMQLYLGKLLATAIWGVEKN